MGISGFRGKNFWLSCGFRALLGFGGEVFGLTERISGVHRDFELLSRFQAFMGIPGGSPAFARKNSGVNRDSGLSRRGFRAFIDRDFGLL